jgi:hypothetical protein
MVFMATRADVAGVASGNKGLVAEGVGNKRFCCRLSQLIEEKRPISR